MLVDKPHEHAIINGQLVRVSASQIQKYDDSDVNGCNRRWWFNKHEHLEDWAGKRGDEGTSSHTRLEHYEKTGEDVLTPHEREAKRFLLPPWPVLKEQGLAEAETYLRFEQEIADLNLELAGVKLTGKIDVANGLGFWVDNEGFNHEMDIDEVEIHDHKTTSNIKYAKSAADLQHNIQMLLYGHAVAHIFDAVESVRLSHGVIQVPPRGKLAKKVSTVMPLARINEIVETSIAPIVARMVEDAKKNNAQDVTPNFNACFAYHKPCPFTEMCVTDPLDRLIGLTFKGENVSLLQKFGVKQPEAAQPVAQPVQAPVPVSGPAAAPSGMLARRLAAQAPVKAPEPVQTFTIPEAEPTVGIVPPDAPPSDPVLAAAGEEGQLYEAKDGQIHQFTKGNWGFAGELSKALYRAQKAGVASAPKAVTEKDNCPPGYVWDGGKFVPTATQVPAPPVAVPETKRRGRPPGSKNVTSAVPPEANPAIAEALPLTKAAEVTLEQTDFSLHIHCLPSYPSTPLEPYINKILDHLQTTSGGVDIRCSKHEALDFGRWKGALTMAIKRNPPPPACYTLTAQGEAFDVAAEAVATFCPDRTVRAV